MLSAYPLCLEWVPSLGDENKVNFVIVGTFLPEIEIWNLDVLDAIEPAFVLGNQEQASKLSKHSHKK